MIAAAIDMERAAELTGYSYERFRRVWAQLPGFPEPFKRPVHGHGTYAWDEADVLAWREARKRSLAVRAAPPAPANDGPAATRRAHDAAVARERGVLARLMARA